MDVQATFTCLTPATTGCRSSQRRHHRNKNTDRDFDSQGFGDVKISLASVKFGKDKLFFSKTEMVTLTNTASKKTRAGVTCNRIAISQSGSAYKGSTT